MQTDQENGTLESSDLSGVSEEEEHSGHFILMYPDKVLRETCKPVTEFNDEVRQLAEQMQELRKAYHGLGLAAPQVGRTVRMFVTADGVFINPKLIWKSRECDLQLEGCLSIPEILVTVRRRKAIEIEYRNLDGATIRRKSSDSETARVWQHEMDHLDGILIVDKVLPAEKSMIKKQLALR